MTEFAMRKDLRATYDEALALVPEALKTEGFGVLSEIDIAATLKKKIDVDFRRYKILGACNPPLAHQALLGERAVGLMLPCNVVVYEADAGHAVVLAIDPVATIASIGVPALAAIAATVRAKLAAVLTRLE